MFENGERDPFASGFPIVVMEVEQEHWKIQIKKRKEGGKKRVEKTRRADLEKTTNKILDF